MILTRRRALASIASLGAASGFASTRLHAAEWRSPDSPFTLGVASGFPTDRSVVLWTRLAPEPLAPGGGMSPRDIEVQWEVAGDERFTRVRRRGVALAGVGFAHSVHVEVGGLEPARDYWYRFTAGGQHSPVGRTRTFAAAGSPLSRLSIAVANCQHFEHGNYAAFAHIAEAAPDLILHLGDYIYEGAGTDGRVRRHNGGTCRTLEDYRQRYAQYHQDPLLQAAHAAAPWMLTWDDHEVANDYAGLQGPRNEDPDAFLARRTAAYRAYYENIPLPPSAAPRGTAMPIHARRTLGDLAAIHLLDQRQYRSAPEGTMLGAAQEQWFNEGLAGQRARWTLIAQGTLVSHLDERPGEGRTFSTDNWNGQPAARERLLGAIRSHAAPNPVILSGDLHAWVIGQVNEVPGQPDSPLLAAEFCTTSITSDPRPQSQMENWRRENPGLVYTQGQKQGYLGLVIEPRRLEAHLMAVEDIRIANSPVSILQRFTMEAGSPQVQSG
jgi:alkaline phosphatase D